MRLKTWAALAVAALGLPLLGGCGNDDANKGEVRIINATTEYTSLDLYTQDSSGNNDLVVSGTAAGAASAYTGVEKGSYTFVVKSGGAAANATTVTGAVAKTDHYSVVTYLTGGAAKATYLTDEESSPASGNAKVRVFNAATGEAASVDVYLTTNDCTALTVTDTAFASAVTGLQTSYAQVTASAAGTPWNVCVFTAGDRSTLLLDIPSLTLKNQEIATLILTHTAGGVLLNGAVLDQQGAMTPYTSAIARIRVAADADSTAPAGLVSVTLNSTEVTSLQASRSVTSYTAIASGALTASVTIDGVTTNGFTLSNTTAGTDYTLLVTGSPSGPTLTLLKDDNTPSTSTTQTVKARFINGVNGSTATLSATIDNRSIGSATFKNQSTSYVTFPATAGTSTVVPSTVTNPTSLTSQTFPANGVYTVFIWGDGTNTPVLSLSPDR
jgi:hypothetical protein